MSSAFHDYWLRGKPDDLPCYDPSWDGTNTKWLDGKLIRMTPPPRDGWHECEDEVYVISVSICGTMRNAYCLTAMSLRPIKGNRLHRSLDMQDAIAIRLASKDDPECDFLIEWDDRRPRVHDCDLEAEIDERTTNSRHSEAIND